MWPPKVLALQRVAEMKNPKGRSQGYISDVQFYCCGVPIRECTVMDELAQSKAEAEGRALLSATASGSILEKFLGLPKMNDMRNFIEHCPRGCQTRRGTV